MSRPWHKKSVNMSWVRDQGLSNTGENATASGEVWLKIILIYGAQLPRDWLTETLGSALGSQLKLYNVYTEQKNLVVFVKIRRKQLSEFRASLGHLREPSEVKPLSCDCNVVNEPGLAPPQPDSPHILPSDWTDILKECISHRYQSTARTLDLSNLHGDHELMSQGLFLALNKIPVANTVCQLLIGNKTSLATLNLANNRLVSTVNFKDLVNPDILVEHLDLSLNPLNGIDSLSHFKGLRGLVSLDISETPIMSQHRLSDSALIGYVIYQ
ncbi:Nuclear RNA export factor [Cichlidogyrus casuarinus]|uniref:Nuclear RNA export factor n=1 Tax=Cichlidogyrus casuarinus TaxID=1844966 RepID=A0ABD2QFB7_9PLAT